MRKKILIPIMGTLLTLSVSGCGDTLNNNELNARSNYKMTQIKRSLATPFSDIFYGLRLMNTLIQKEDYAAAKTLSLNLYDDFHDAILPSIIAKKGKTFADGIDGKYDELVAAISNKNKPKIQELIKVNHNNLKKIAPMLGVSVISNS